MATPTDRLCMAETPLLQIGYETHGPAEGRPVLLLHGWPDDPRTWDAVVLSLVERGYRTIAPYLRGFGATRFRDAATPRTAEMTAMAADAMALLDAIGIAKVIVAGHDWGARIGYVLAALWPERVERLVAMSVEYQTGITPGSQLDYAQQRAFWYQWFFASERGRESLVDNPRGLCRELWQMWSPTWSFDEDTFNITATSWDNPDWVDITLHSYRYRWGHAPINSRYADLEARMKQRPVIAVPTVHLHGEADRCVLAASLKNPSSSFAGEYHRVLLPRVGHFIPRERPHSVVEAIDSGRR